MKPSKFRKKSTKGRAEVWDKNPASAEITENITFDVYQIKTEFNFFFLFFLKCFHESISKYPTNQKIKIQNYILAWFDRKCVMADSLTILDSL